MCSVDFYVVVDSVWNNPLHFTDLQLELGVIYHCFDGTLYTGRRSHGAFCNGVRLKVSKEKRGCYLSKFFLNTVCEICVQDKRFLSDPFLLPVLDFSKALILTEIGAKRDPHTLDIFLGNMKQLLSGPVHG